MKKKHLGCTLLRELSNLRGKCNLLKRFIPFFLLLFVPYVVEAQVTLKEKNSPLGVVLNKIESSTDYAFLYNDVTIDEKQPVTINVEKAEIKSVLNKLFAKTNITYTISGKQIILATKQAETPGAKIKATGVVKDELGDPLIGVSVSVKNRQIGEMTDANGNFYLNVNKGDVLVFSYTGFLTQSIVVADEKPINIVLLENTIELDAVVVTAMGIKRERKSLTYNVQELKAEGVTKVKDANFINSLAGKVAGVTINQSSSGVGGSTRVIMRGTKSLFGENNALYVLDGIPLQGLKSKQSDNFYEGAEGNDGDGISMLNADDIESMSILTGASAAALYGNKGANGVILVTTKKGSKKLKVGYSNSTSFLSPFVLPKFQNTYGRKEGEFKSWGDKLETPSSYRPKDFFQTGYSTINSISVSKGTETNQTYASLGAVNAEGVIDKNEYERYNLSIRNSTQLVQNVLEMDLSLYYTKQKNQNSIAQGMYFNPLVPIYLFPPSDDINKYRVYERYDLERNFPVQYWPYGNQAMGMQNPYWINNKNMFNTDRNRYMVSGSLKWNINSWINVIGRGRFDRADSKFERKLYASTDGLYATKKGHFVQNEDENQTIYLDALASLDKRLSNDFRLIANLGASYLDEKYGMIGYQGNLITIPNFFHFNNMAKIEGNPSKTSLHTQTQATYAKVELGYKNFLYADVSGRFDFFSTLAGTSKKHVFYPAVGGSAVLSEVLPLPKNIISYLKIRGAFAEVGNPPPAYLTNEYVTLGSGSIDMDSFVPAKHLKAEMTRSFELGLDFNLFYNKISVAATYYNSNTYNQLFKYKMPPSSGYAYAYENAGKVNNQGIELSIGLNQKLGPVDWHSNIIYSLNKNKIKTLLPEFIENRVTGNIVKSPTEFEVSSAESYKMILREGGSMSDIYATGLKQDNNGYIYVNPMTGAIEAETNEYKKVGQASPKYNLGFRNSFSYKGLELDFLIDARVGGQVVSATQALLDQFGASEATAKARDNGGVMVNNGLMNAESYYGVVSAGKTGLLAHYVYSATNVRLREVSLNYTIPPALLNSKLNIVVSLTGRNIWMIHNEAPFDPELTANTGTYYQGFDYFMPPSMRNIGFGVKVNF